MPLTAVTLYRTCSVVIFHGRVYGDLSSNPLIVPGDYHNDDNNFNCIISIFVSLRTCLCVSRFGWTSVSDRR